MDRRRRWRSSLYARAALFLALGAASFVGAVAVLSGTMVDDSVERLLAERLELARTVGAFVEQRMSANLARLSTVSADSLASGDPAAVRDALATEYHVGIYQEGAFALDGGGALIAVAPSDLRDTLASVDLGAMIQVVDARGGVATTQVLPLGRGERPVVIMLGVVKRKGERLGYVGGVMPVTDNNALAPALHGQRGIDSVMDLVDTGGVVVASTDARRLLVPGDHDEVLSKAIRDGRGLRGRCHGCHTTEQNPARVETVLAFAPLPSLSLGVAVQQPETDALAPAFALQRRLVVIGVSFVALFLLFAGLSVRSVVDPVKRLTREVRTVEAGQGRAALPAFGRDEVGVLASTLERWRSGLIDSLQTAEKHRQALNGEMERTRQHLEALQEIAGQYTLGADAEAIVEHGLDSMLHLLGLSRGVARVEFGEREIVVRRLMPADQAARLLDACVAEVERGRGDAVRCPPVDGPDGGRLATVIGAHHVVPRGIRVDCVLADRADRPDVEPRWLSSLVHHLGISVTSRLLHDQELARQQLQEQYLHRVMRAQEDERRRVARELHDTVAQDLAALRLEVERLGGRPECAPLRAEFEALERRAGEVLESVRRTLFDLRLTVLENLGFLPTLQWHLERMEKQNGIRGILAVRGPEREPEYDTAVALFRIFQESLQNVVAHARAEHVSVTVRFADGHVEMVIEDDGRGFDVTQARTPSDTGRGLGLLGMEERARLVRGTVSIESVVGEGTTVTVSAPMPTLEVSA
ncbi:MAG: hypothetical protein AMXMBFR64_12520 [Myxococcales bacterium]